MKYLLIAILICGCSVSKVIDTGTLVKYDRIYGNTYTIYLYGSDSCTKYWATWRAKCFYCNYYKVPEKWIIKETRNGFAFKPIK